MSITDKKLLLFIESYLDNIVTSLAYNCFEFTVDVRKAGEGQLEIMVNNGNLPNTVESEETGVYQISFVPETSGRQTVDITFNKENHPGTFVV